MPLQLRAGVAAATQYEDCGDHGSADKPSASGFQSGHLHLIHAPQSHRERTGAHDMSKDAAASRGDVSISAAESGRSRGSLWIPTGRRWYVRNGDAMDGRVLGSWTGRICTSSFR